MARIFVSYRREDSAGHTQALFDRLLAHFGADRVFMDVTGIQPGLDFAEALDNAVGSCDVFLAVIGREWLTVTDGAGRRRLDDAGDFVRLETATALRLNIRVIPVLVGGATMPTASELPDSLVGLTRHQACELRHSSWDDDVRRLIRVITGEREALLFDFKATEP